MAIKSTLLYLFYNNMFLSFQTLGAFIHQDFSILRLVSIFIAAVSDFFLRRSLLNFNDYRNFRDITGFLQKFPACHFETVPLERAVGRTVMASLQTVDPFNPRGTESWLKVFRVRIDKAPEMIAKRPTTDLAFLGSRSAYLFVNSEIDRMSPQQRFRLLHEIGHASQTAFYLSHRELILGLPFVHLLAWWIFQRNTDATPDWILTVLAIFLGLLQLLHSTVGRVYFDALNEAVADQFALTHLSHCERLKFAKYMLEKFERRFPFDVRLLTFNEERASDLRAKLELIQEERGTKLDFKEIRAQHSSLWWIGPVLATALVVLSVPVSPAEIVGLSLITVCIAVVAGVTYLRRKGSASYVSREMNKRTDIRKSSHGEDE